MKEILAPDTFLFRVLPKAKPQTGVVYIPSQFNIPFDCDGKRYVFNMLTKQCLEGELPRQARAGEGFDPLIETYLLVPEGKDECAFYESVSAMLRRAAHSRKTHGYVILPTLHCNARCVYCYEEGRPQTRMAPETVEQTLRYILATHAEEGIKLNWFGGEPLLCPDIIDRISRGVKEAGIPYRSNVVTNGSLLTPEILEKMLGLWNTRSIQISMDGAEPDYIARKRYYSDSDQYHAVMETIGRVSAAGITVALRINVDEGNWPGIPAFMQDLKQWVGNKDRVLVYFSPLMSVRAGEKDLDFWKKTIAARPLIAEAGFKTLKYTEPVMKFRINRCMADSNTAVIGPDGSLYPCEHCEPGSRYGDIFRGVTDEATKRKYTCVDGTRAMCRKCPLLPGCTSYAHCPWVDYHCREAHELLTVEALKRMVRSAGQAEGAQDEDELLAKEI